MKKGIDVSRHQGIIDWKKVKQSGIDFTILRAGYGKIVSQKDSFFEQNYAGCVEAGIPVGVYWYSYAMSEKEAQQEAAACLSCIQGKQFEYPVFFDIEEKKQLALGKTACSKIAAAFLEAMEEAGYFVGIYSSKSHLENYISEELRKQYAIWVAHYGVEKTNYSGDFGMWQKSDKGKISGISGNVDLDECYVDYPEIIRNAGLNCFTKPEEIPAEKTIQEMAQEIISGKWGNGEDRKKRLLEAGYDYAAIQAVVNEIVAKPKRIHTVAKGDTLSAIAKKYGTTVQKILDENKAAYPKMTADHIQIGWKLKV